MHKLVARSLSISTLAGLLVSAAALNASSETLDDVMKRRGLTL